MWKKLCSCALWWCEKRMGYGYYAFLPDAPREPVMLFIVSSSLISSSLSSSVISACIQPLLPQGYLLSIILWMCAPSFGYASAKAASVRRSITLTAPHSGKISHISFFFFRKVVHQPYEFPYGNLISGSAPIWLSWTLTDPNTESHTHRTMRQARPASGYWAYQAFFRAWYSLHKINPYKVHASFPVICIF